MGTGVARNMASRVACMFLPVDRSITVSAPHLTAHNAFCTSSSVSERERSVYVGVDFDEVTRSYYHGLAFGMSAVGG